MDSPSPVSKTPLRATIRKIELPWFILAALLLSTLVTAYQNSRQLRADTQARFQEITQDEQRAILRKLGDFEDLMHGAAALVVALPNLKQATWDTFFDSRMPKPDSYVGLVALQYVPVKPVASTVRTKQRRAVAR